MKLGSGTHYSKRKYEGVRGRSKGDWLLDGNYYVKDSIMTTDKARMKQKCRYEGGEGLERLWGDVFKKVSPNFYKKTFDDDFHPIMIEIPNESYDPEWGKKNVKFYRWMRRFAEWEVCTSLTDEPSDGVEKRAWTVERWEEYDGMPLAVSYPYTCMERQELYDVLGYEEFVPHIMLNISPNWSACQPFDWSSFEGAIELQIKALRDLMDKVVQMKFWSDWSYVIERGGNPQRPHVHVHAVLKMNKDCIKSCRSYVKNNSNLKRDVRKLWAMEGCEKALDAGPAIQVKSLNNDELVKDKKDYLIEEKKPLAHRNVPDERFGNLLFTSKS